MKGRIGSILLGVWLLFQGLIPLLDFHIRNLDTIMALLAIGAGILILMDK